MAFKLNLSPAQRERIASERSYVHVCFAVDDTELGQMLLKLAVGLRDGYPAEYGDSGAGQDTCSLALVWEVVPEIARRLGVVDFRRGKRPYACQNDDDFRLRSRACDVIFGSHSRVLGADGILVDPPSLSLLKREPCNGNPVVIGLDRVAPPQDDRSDHLAWRIAEVSQTRGFPRQLAWSPAMDGTRRSAEPVDDPVAFMRI